MKEGTHIDTITLLETQEVYRVLNKKTNKEETRLYSIKYTYCTKYKNTIKFFYWFIELQKKIDKTSYAKVIKFIKKYTFNIRLTIRDRNIEGHFKKFELMDYKGYNLNGRKDSTDVIK